MGFPDFLRLAWADRGARNVSISVSGVFVILYVLMVGIVFPLPYVLPESFPALFVQTVFDEPFGQYPMLIVYVARRWVFSINPEAITALSALTTLVALNTVTLLHVRRYRVCRITRNTHLSWAAVVPSFFSFFTCCGGGVVFSLLLSAGAGLSILSFLQEYGRFFTGASAALLSANLYLVYREYSRSVVTSSANG
ncbi:MAG: hypothetical protein NZ921_04210 [Candidatus Caldarchaeum sp.]|nr:hypothetical protein [Candidatus Caldarchaeum sp.]